MAQESSSHTVDHAAIARKWQQAWKEARLGIPLQDKEKKKFFMIWAYATVSGFQHTGHMRGYSYTDAVCRYKRMRGYNVLLTAGGHATGNGAIAKAQKIQEKDPRWVEEFTSRGIPKEELSTLSDPQSFVEYFTKIYVQEYERFGFLGDWDRFITTTTPDYNKFIEWQFHQLNKKGLLIQKPYFATACEECGPVSVDPSEMDLSKGGNAETHEYTLVKLRFEKDNQFIVCATLRPETMYGQTNIWVDPNETYVKLQVGKEVWILSQQAAKKLSFQKDNTKTVGEISAKDLLGKHCYAKRAEQDILILPSEFCDASIGTGIVTSVPSDAPHDYMGLYDLQSSQELCEHYGLDYEKVKAITPIPIIKTPGYNDFPAIEICQRLGIKDQHDPKLEEAKKEIYKAGFHAGVLRDNCAPYAGLKVSVAKEAIKEEMITSQEADIMYDLSEEVVCRCAGEVIIKKTEGQWFIKYSDEELTKKSKEHASIMNILPQNYADNIQETLDWFEDRPCARQGRWLGTTFPFDKTYIIEAISDSTLYPIYYLISKYVNQGSLTFQQLTQEFFDHVFLGIGTNTEVSAKTNISTELLAEIRADVEYWYPLDINLSGKEHRRVHFPPFIMNHVAILPQKYWPKGLFVHEWVMQAKNEKLSKSKGGAQPIPEALATYGADSMRLYYANISSPFADIYFNEEDLVMYKNKLERFYQFFEDINTNSSQECGSPEKVLLSKLNRKTGVITQLLDSFDFKKATDIIYIDLFKDLQGYIKKGGANKHTIKEFINTWVLLLVPFTPHTAEELWSIRGNTELASAQSWPVSDQNKLDLDAEFSEELVTSVLDDLQQVKKLSNITTPQRATILISEQWKYDVYRELKELFTTTKDFKTIITTLMSHESFKQQAKPLTKMIPQLIKKGLPTFLQGQQEEHDVLVEHKDLFAQALGIKSVEIVLAQDSPHPKAQASTPSKPAIILE